MLIIMNLRNRIRISLHGTRCTIRYALYRSFLEKQRMFLVLGGSSHYVHMYSYHASFFSKIRVFVVDESPHPHFLAL